MRASLANWAPIIDHTLLKADATAEQIDKLCREALNMALEQYGE